MPRNRKGALMHCPEAMRAVLGETQNVKPRIGFGRMAGFYHLSVKMIGRTEGRSAVACAAYRSGQTLEDERYAKVHDYAPRRGITRTGILAPEDAPAWALDRQRLWNRVEAAEKRKDAQLAREFELALPHQLPQQEMAGMVETFISEQLIPRGMIVDYAIHSPNRAGDERNWHAHLMTTLRPLEDGQLSKLKDREACAPEMIQQWREAWAEIQNRTFERLQVRGDDGQILRVDHRSYEQQGINREPTQHMGVLATGMERNGKVTEIGERNRAILQANDNRQMLRREAGQLHREEAELLLRGNDRPDRYRPNADRDRSDRGRDYDL